MAESPAKELWTLHAFFRGPQASGHCEVSGGTGRGELPQTCSASDTDPRAPPSSRSPGRAGCALGGCSSLLARYAVTKASSRARALRVVFSSA